MCTCNGTDAQSVFSTGSCISTSLDCKYRATDTIRWKFFFLCLTFRKTYIWVWDEINLWKINIPPKYQRERLRRSGLEWGMSQGAKNGEKIRQRGCLAANISFELKLWLWGTPDFRNTAITKLAQIIIIQYRLQRFITSVWISLFSLRTLITPVASL